MELERENYQREIDGAKVDLYALRNRNGMVVKVTNWGAKVQQILVPDRAGKLGDVALGYDTLSQLRAGQSSMGAFIGRYAGRIAQARFTLNGRQYLLAANSGPNSLHGGDQGSRFRTFEATQVNDASVVMRYTFEDGEEGFPGTLSLRVTYSVNDANELVLEYDALAADKPTVANFTTRIFFNLAGHDRGDVWAARANRPVPAGERRPDPDRRAAPVRSSPMDHAPSENRRAHWPEGRATEDRPGLRPSFRAEQEGRGLSFAARHEPVSRRDGSLVRRARHRSIRATTSRASGRATWARGAVYASRAGFCLEPSHFPDSPNQPSFRPRS